MKQILIALVCLCYAGKDAQLLKARDAGEKYLRDVLLPQWTADPTFRTDFPAGTGSQRVFRGGFWKRTIIPTGSRGIAPMNDTED